MKSGECLARLPEGESPWASTCVGKDCWHLRLAVVLMLCFCAVADSPLFTLHSSLLHAQGVQSGKASFYSKRATGARTANGERLHHDSLTCAHRTYPFGTMLKVTNMQNGKEVVVRVTDRGPYRKGRIIDLSWGAAKAIGMLAQGITTVKVERVSPGFVVPFKPEESRLDQPIYEFDIAEIADGAMPIWKVDDKIDDKKVKRQMTATVEAKTADQQSDAATDHPSAIAGKPALGSRKQTEPASQSAVVSRKQGEPGKHATRQNQVHKNKTETTADVLDVINTQPNRSKAYLKRQGGK